MSTEIREQESQGIPIYSDNVIDFEARRWIWSASLTESLAKFGCGYDEIKRQELLPLNTYTRSIPVEEPAKIVDSGLESEAISPLGSTLFTYAEPVGMGLPPRRLTGTRRTAAQLCHDILYEFNAVVPRGIGEIKALRGKFATLPTVNPTKAHAEKEELKALYRQIHPLEVRVTLKKTVDWFSNDVSVALDGAPAKWADIVESAWPEFRALAMQAEFFGTDWIDKSETELEQSAKNGQGKKRLDDTDRHWLRELERTERSLMSVKQSVDANRELGEQIGTSIVEGLKATNSTNNSDDVLTRLAALEAENKKLQAAVKKSPTTKE